MRWVIGLAAVTLTVTTVWASGTYRPPKAPEGISIDKETREAGEKLYRTAELVGKNGKTCASCHEKGKKHHFRRSVLRKTDTQLFDRVQACLTDASRTAGEKLEGGSDSAKQLGAYIGARYQLSWDQLEKFFEKKGE